jgi:hypothetical protein
MRVYLHHKPQLHLQSQVRLLAHKQLVFHTRIYLRRAAHISASGYANGYANGYRYGYEYGYGYRTHVCIYGPSGFERLVNQQVILASKVTMSTSHSLNNSNLFDIHKSKYGTIIQLNRFNYDF